MQILFSDGSENLPVNLDLGTAYTPLDEWKLAHPGENPPEASIRIFHGRFSAVEPDLFESTDDVLVFDDKDPGHQVLLAKCKEDSKALRLALQTALRAEGLPISVSKSGWKRLSVRILPPFLESENLPEEPDRQNVGEDEILLCVHVDRNQVFQYARFYQSESSVSPAWDQLQEELCDLVGDWFRVPENYGHWDELAHHVSLKLGAFLAPVLHREISTQAELNEEWSRSILPPKVALKRHWEAFLQRVGLNEAVLSGYAFSLQSLARESDLNFSLEYIKDLGLQVLHRLRQRGASYEKNREKAA